VSRKVDRVHRISTLTWRHPDRSRFSGGERDLPHPAAGCSEIPRRWCKRGLQDDASQTISRDSKVHGEDET
jgi:hypothetical protein